MKNVVFRIVILAIVAVVLMSWVGWLTFNRSDGRSTIEVNTGEMERAAGKAVEAGRDLVDQTGDSIRSSAEEADNELERRPSVD